MLLVASSDCAGILDHGSGMVLDHGTGVLAFLTINQTEWRLSRRPMNSRVVH